MIRTRVVATPLCHCEERSGEAISSQWRWDFRAPLAGDCFVVAALNDSASGGSMISILGRIDPQRATP